MKDDKRVMKELRDDDKRVINQQRDEDKKERENDKKEMRLQMFFTLAVAFTAVIVPYYNPKI